MLKESNIPVIILERLDSSISWFREFDMIPNLKGIIKNRLIEPIDYMNSEYYYGRYHYRLMYNSFIINNNINIKEKDLSNSFYAGLQKLPLISNDNLKKFHHTLWDIKSSPLGGPCKNLRKFTINYNDKRYYDIFCVNREKRYSRLGKKKAKNIINNMTDLNVITKELNQNEFNEKLLNSKICVACWGWGEWIHLDASAMYAGTILIKPDTSHVKMYPDIYKNNITYIPCKPDYSNLEEVIRNTLNNYNKLIDMRKKIENYYYHYQI